MANRTEGIAGYSKALLRTQFLARSKVTPNSGPAFGGSAGKQACKKGEFVLTRVFGRSFRAWVKLQTKKSDP